MAKLLLNADGKVLTSNDKVLKAPEVEDRLKKLLNATKKTYYLFYEYSGTSVDDLIKYEDTENVTDMSSMFFNCDQLQTIPQLDTSKVTSMSGMFQKCPNLQTIPQLDTSNVTSMGNMFYTCSSLQTISPLDTSNVINMYSMFHNCYKLQTIDITSMDKISSASKSSNMCYCCYSLTKFIIRTMTVIPSLSTNSFNSCYHFKGTVDSTYNPKGLKDGRIYVPDNKVDSLKTATNWSAYADIIVPLSTLQEA